MASLVNSIKDATNPFVRLITTATADDGSTGAPFYLLEQIREAAFQSDYACETIHRSLLQRMEYYRSYPFITSKVLGVIRMLMLEGPSGFNQRMGQSSAKILQLITEWNNHSVDQIRRGSLEERNRDLAQAIHAAIGGDPKPLQKFGVEGGAGNTAAATPSQGSAGLATTVTGRVITCKSDYQAQQEREQKLHKKRVDEERSRDPLVVHDRLLEVFDGHQTPAKLVESAVTSPKKKFAKEELHSFVEAAIMTGKVMDVCGALDAVLRDGKASLQSRYKILTIVDALVHFQPAPIADVIAFFKSHTLGLARHLTIERADNPVKAEAAKAAAQAIVATVQSTIITAPQASSASVASQRARGNSTVSSSAHAQPQEALWTWNGPNAAPSGSSAVDDLFSNLTIKGSASVVPQQPQLTAAPSQQASGWDQFWGSTGPLSAVPPKASSNSPQQGSGTPPFGVQLMPTQSPPLGFTAPPNHSFPTGAASSASLSATTATGALGGWGSSFAAPPAPNTSFTSTTGYHGGSSIHAPPVPNTSLAAPPAAAAVSQQEMIRMQMEEMQRNMARMMQAIAAQQQQPQPPQGSAPQPEPELTQVSSHMPLPPPNARSETPPPTAPVATSASDSVAEIQRSPELQTAPIAAPAPDAHALPHAVTPTPTMDTSAAMAMMLQLQQQMAATQQMLAQQQQAFQALQTQLFQKPQ